MVRPRSDRRYWFDRKSVVGDDRIDQVPVVARREVVMASISRKVSVTTVTLQKPTNRK
jgi:hypothetical protein